MLKSDTITKLAEALLNAQKKITVAVRNAEGNRGKYANFEAVIDAVKEPLNENNIVLIQAVNFNREDGVFIETTLLHTSGEFCSSTTPIYCIKPNDPQALGSGITYSKRYSIQSLLGLPSTDDDGELASKEKPKRIEITDAQQAYIDKVGEKLIDSLPENMAIDSKKLSAFLYAIKGSYPDDLNTVGAAAAYIINGGKIKNLCKATK